MKIAIIGSKGYIGSVLSKELKNCEIIYFDYFDYKDIKSLDAIIYLAGKTSRSLQIEEMHYNIDHIMEIAKLMTINQLLIYASTSAIYEGSVNADENIVLNENLLDVYSRSMLARENSIKSLSNIRSIGLRLATVVGISSKQRSDRIHIQMLKSAIFTGRIHVRNPYGWRPIISMTETVAAFQSIIDQHQSIIGHKIYNVSSFNTTVSSIASSIARITQANIIYEDSPNLIGFSVNNDKFKKDFAFKFSSTNETIIQELWQRREELLDSWKTSVTNATCIICKNNKMIELIDLGPQPLANQFTKNPDNVKRYPLAMHRCSNCFHNQLSYIVPCEDLFSDYIYVSGTAKTNSDYFDDFCNKITHNREIGTILDIACNDGSQLDKFRDKGWTTYGVDPAQNLAPISQEKGHNIIVGFWGDPKIESQLPDNFDIMIAQNVLAHVSDPIKFIKACRDKMAENTLLYVQTSQAELFLNGEFDTLYHEHISFFTIKSMLYLSNICGLYLSNVEKVAIHGVSYIFTLRFKRSDDLDVHPNVTKMIENEKEIYSPYNSIFYKCHVDERRTIIQSMIDRCHRDQLAIVAFGASAKGNTLLNSLNCKALPEYIVDENPLKQNLYCPGTGIPVVSYDHFVNDRRPLAILVLAWNFLKEIKSKVLQARAGKDLLTILMVPFPNTSVVLLRGNNWVDMSTFKLRSSLELTQRPQTLLVTHFYNEELLLPYWILHHAPMFDNVVLIDHHSTDSSCEIIKNLAPSNWKIVKSTLSHFDAQGTDLEVRNIERSFPDSTWKISLTVTEFLIWPDMNNSLLSSHHWAHQIPLLLICGNDELPLKKNIPLIQQRNVPTSVYIQPRFIHRNTNLCGQLYTVGRHTIQIPAQPQIDAVIFKYGYSPWPEILPRKLQIGAKQSQSDIMRGLGGHHQYKEAQISAEKTLFMERLEKDFFRNGWNGNELELLRSKILHKQLQLPWSNSVGK